jgi:glucose/arabinose dehydrogenase
MKHTILIPGRYLDRIARRVPGRFLGSLCALGFGVVCGATSLASAQGGVFSTEFVVAGLDRPVFLTAPPGDSDRVFVVEQHTGQIRILRLADSTLDMDAFLTVPDLGTASEGGLLGLAFDPDYASNGYFYVYIANPDSHVLRYQVSADPDVAASGSRLEILQIDQPQTNHNGGWIGFGADGFLYVASGDGGGSDDNDTGHTPGLGNAQDLTDNLLGKLLRIDVHGDDFPNDADRNYAIPADNPFVGQVGMTRSGSTDCAIRGGRASIPRRTTCSSPTSVRIAAKS